MRSTTHAWSISALNRITDRSEPYGNNIALPAFAAEPRDALGENLIRPPQRRAGGTIFLLSVPHTRSTCKPCASQEEATDMPAPPRTNASDMTVHLLSLNAGLSCDRDSLSLTAATVPSVAEAPVIDGAERALQGEAQ